MNAPPAGISIRPPTDPERRACRMLLPGTLDDVRDLQLFVAAERGDDGRERVMGAGALALDPRLSEADGWLVDVHVVPPVRRRGIGRALTERLVALARATGVGAVHAWRWADADSDEARAWAGLGFVPGDRKYEYAGTVEDFVAALEPLYQQLRARGRIPAEARVIPLREADPLAVATLHVRHLGSSLERVLPLITGADPKPFHPDYSTVLLLGDAVVGATLGHIEATTGDVVVDSVVIDPVVRRGWANVWVRREASIRLRDDGVRRMRFTALERHKDTQHGSERIGSRLTRTQVRFRRPTTGPVPARNEPPPAAAAEG